VWYLGLCPTPCVAYLTGITNAMGGIMISASHNPPEDNGIKIFNADGGKLPQALQMEIEAGLRGKLSLENKNNCGKHYYRAELIKDYSQAIQAPLQSGLNLQG
ncbi:MAG: phosphoglucosamine mutase, partial [Dolichospermum sp.]